jgi:hypothetical protein
VVPESKAWHPFFEKRKGLQRHNIVHVAISLTYVKPTNNTKSADAMDRANTTEMRIATLEVTIVVSSQFGADGKS